MRHLPWHKHHENPPSSDAEVFDKDKDLEIQKQGKDLAKKLLAQEEEKLGRKLTLDEKKGLARKFLADFLDDIEIK